MLVTLPDEKDMVVEVKHHTCDFHKENPGEQWPGCTCFSSYSQSYSNVDKQEGTVYQHECIKMARKYEDGKWFDYDFEKGDWVARMEVECDGECSTAGEVV